MSASPTAPRTHNDISDIAAQSLDSFTSISTAYSLTHLRNNPYAIPQLVTLHNQPNEPDATPSGHKGDVRRQIEMLIDHFAEHGGYKYALDQGYRMKEVAALGALSDGYLHSSYLKQLRQHMSLDNPFSYPAMAFALLHTDFTDGCYTLDLEASTFLNGLIQSLVTELMAVESFVYSSEALYRSMLIALQTAIIKLVLYSKRTGQKDAGAVPSVLKCVQHVQSNADQTYNLKHIAEVVEVQVGDLKQPEALDLDFFLNRVKPTFTAIALTGQIVITLGQGKAPDSKSAAKLAKTIDSIALKSDKLPGWFTLVANYEQLLFDALAELARGSGSALEAALKQFADLWDKLCEWGDTLPYEVGNKLNQSINYRYGLASIIYKLALDPPGVIGGQQLVNDKIHSAALLAQEQFMQFTATQLRCHTLPRNLAFYLLEGCFCLAGGVRGSLFPQHGLWDTQGAAGALLRDERFAQAKKELLEIVEACEDESLLTNIGPGKAGAKQWKKPGIFDRLFRRIDGVASQPEHLIYTVKQWLRKMKGFQPDLSLSENVEKQLNLASAGESPPNLYREVFGNFRSYSEFQLQQDLIQFNSQLSAQYHTAYYISLSNDVDNYTYNDWSWNLQCTTFVQNNPFSQQISRALSNRSSDTVPAFELQHVEGLNHLSRRPSARKSTEIPLIDSLQNREFVVANGMHHDKFVTQVSELHLDQLFESHRVLDEEDHVLDVKRRLVVLTGGGGSGKSALTAYLAFKWSQQAWMKYIFAFFWVDARWLLPSLRQNDEDAYTKLARAICSNILKKVPRDGEDMNNYEEAEEIVLGMLHGRSRQGEPVRPCLVVIDGLNELGDAAQPFVELFRAEKEHLYGLLTGMSTDVIKDSLLHGRYMPYFHVMLGVLQPVHINAILDHHFKDQLDTKRELRSFIQLEDSSGLTRLPHYLHLICYLWKHQGQTFRRLVGAGDQGQRTLIRCKTKLLHLMVDHLHAESHQRRQLPSSYKSFLEQVAFEGFTTLHLNQPKTAFSNTELNDINRAHSCQLDIWPDSSHDLHQLHSFLRQWGGRHRFQSKHMQAYFAGGLIAKEVRRCYEHAQNDASQPHHKFKVLALASKHKYVTAVRSCWQFAGGHLGLMQADEGEACAVQSRLPHEWQVLDTTLLCMLLAWLRAPPLEVGGVQHLLLELSIVNEWALAVPKLVQGEYLERVLQETQLLARLQSLVLQGLEQVRKMEAKAGKVQGETAMWVALRVCITKYKVISRYIGHFCVTEVHRLAERGDVQLPLLSRSSTSVMADAESLIKLLTDCLLTVSEPHLASQALELFRRQLAWFKTDERWSAAVHLATSVYMASDSSHQLEHSSEAMVFLLHLLTDDDKPQSGALEVPLRYVLSMLLASSHAGATRQHAQLRKQLQGIVGDLTPHNLEQHFQPLTIVQLARLGLCGGSNGQDAASQAAMDCAARHYLSKVQSAAPGSSAVSAEPRQLRRLGSVFGSIDVSNEHIHDVLALFAVAASAPSWRHEILHALRDVVNRDAGHASLVQSSQAYAVFACLAAALPFNKLVIKFVQSSSRLAAALAKTDTAALLQILAHWGPAARRCLSCLTPDGSAQVRGLVCNLQPEFEGQLPLRSFVEEAHKLLSSSEVSDAAQLQQAMKGLCTWGTVEGWLPGEADAEQIARNIWAAMMDSDDVGSQDEDHLRLASSSSGISSIEGCVGEEGIDENARPQSTNVLPTSLSAIEEGQPKYASQSNSLQSDFGDCRVESPSDYQPVPAFTERSRLGRLLYSREANLDCRLDNWRRGWQIVTAISPYVRSQRPFEPKLLLYHLQEGDPELCALVLNALSSLVHEHPSMPLNNYLDVLLAWVEGARECPARLLRVWLHTLTTLAMATTLDAQLISRLEGVLQAFFEGRAGAVARKPFMYMQSLGTLRSWIRCVEQLLFRRSWRVEASDGAAGVPAGGVMKEEAELAVAHALEGYNQLISHTDSLGEAEASQPMWVWLKACTAAQLLISSAGSQGLAGSRGCSRAVECLYMAATSQLPQVRMLSMLCMDRLTCCPPEHFVELHEALSFAYVAGKRCEAQTSALFKAFGCIAFERSQQYLNFQLSLAFEAFVLSKEAKLFIDQLLWLYLTSREGCANDALLRRLDDEAQRTAVTVSIQKGVHEGEWEVHVYGHTHLVRSFEVLGPCARQRLKLLLDRARKRQMAVPTGARWTILSAI